MTISGPNSLHQCLGPGGSVRSSTIGWCWLIHQYHYTVHICCTCLTQWHGRMAQMLVQMNSIVMDPLTAAPGEPQCLLVFVFTLIAATNSDTRNQVRWANCFHWSFKCWVTTKASTTYGSPGPGMKATDWRYTQAICQARNNMLPHIPSPSGSPSPFNKIARLITLICWS